ncbi:hypothetical protein KP509_08G069800 [Ceratopteris richardii]|uniref:1-phosphatidylinositol 4-kinase n=1 Tax=Ceratopteris richardii TaxID=49495 RepID=A0A8T2UD96_CERRI|nr:hypothetical protein KP509_08G069800 [Ceratopteris richardii]
MGASTLIANPVAVDKLTPSGMCRHASKPCTLAGKPIQVFLVTVGKDSSSYLLQVSESETVACVKLRIQERRGFFVDQQRLVYAGKELTKDECFLKDYDVQDGDVLYLVLLIPNLISLTLRTIKNSSFVYKVWQSKDSQDLRKLICTGRDDSSNELPVLSLKAEQLESLGIAEESSVKGECLLFLRVHQPRSPSRLIDSNEVELAVSSADGIAPLFSTVAVRSSENAQYDEQSGSKDGLQHMEADSEDKCRRHGLRPPARLLLPSKYPFSFDLPNSMKKLLSRVRMGLNAGQTPSLTSEGSGGVYLLKDECGSCNIAVFKPMDEEPMSVNNPRGFSRSNLGEGLRRGTRSGEGAIREVAAFVLDHPAKMPGNRTVKDLAKKEMEGFSGVPPTTLVRCYHEALRYGSTKHLKLGSLQEFVDAFSSCEDMGASMFPVEEVHKISVLDLRLANTDRNGGNILVRKDKDQALKLIPIDHGYCLPDKFEDCSFEWLYWPQAQQPYSSSTLEYIKSLDAKEDIGLLEACGWRMRPRNARVFCISTMLLKKGAAAGLTPFQIGSIVSRGESLDTKSVIEHILDKVEAMRCKEDDFLRVVEELLDDHITSMKR